MPNSLNQFSVYSDQSPAAVRTAMNLARYYYAQGLMGIRWASKYRPVTSQTIESRLLVAIAIDYYNAARGSIAGYAYLVIYKRTHQARIREIARWPKPSCDGAGTALLDKCIDYARDYWCTSIVLDVHDNNTHAIQFYLSHHFYRSGTTSKGYRIMQYDIIQWPK